MTVSIVRLFRSHKGLHWIGYLQRHIRLCILSQTRVNDECWINVTAMLPTKISWFISQCIIYIKPNNYQGQLSPVLKHWKDLDFSSCPKNYPQICKYTSIFTPKKRRYDTAYLVALFCFCRRWWRMYRKAQMMTTRNTAMVAPDAILAVSSITRCRLAKKMKKQIINYRKSFCHFIR